MVCTVVSISWPSFDSSRNGFLRARQLLLPIFPLFLFFKVVTGFQIKMPQVVPIPIIFDIPHGTFSVSSEFCVNHSNYIITFFFLYLSCNSNEFSSDYSSFLPNHHYIILGVIPIFSIPFFCL